MNADERAQQERTLAKLQWLNERRKVDFRGNPSPFEAKKTLQSVEHERRAKARALAGGSDFLPFWHGNTPLALTATRCDYIRAVEDGQPSSSAGVGRCSYGAQAVDPVTGLTEIRLALSWNVPHGTPPAPQGCTDETATIAPAGQQHNASRTQRQPTSGRRMCTHESGRVHDARWGAATQLDAAVAKPPPRRPRNAALHQQNSVRAVHLLHTS